MGTVNTQSVREEANRIKTELDRLSATTKMSSEVAVLLQSMLMLINLLISIFLEKSTKKTTKNSSLPSSKSDKDESAPDTTTVGTKGKGRPESNATANNTRTVETVVVAKVDHCDVCGHDLTDTPCTQHERRTTIDIIFEKTVTHVDAEIKPCENCNSTVKAPFPADMQGPKQYGNGLKAYIINLLVCQMISLNRAQKMVKALIGEVLSEATALKFVFRLYLALAEWEASAIEQIIKSPTMHVDETSLKVDKRKFWVHVYASGDITLKFLHKKRGTEAIEEINIIPRYRGRLIHDFLASYLTYEKCDHGMCGGHLVRELEFIVESNGYRWAQNMINLLLETNSIVSKKKAKKLTPKEYKNLQKRYRNILTRGNKELPEIPAKPNGKRGRIAKSDAHNLWDRFKNYEDEILLFAKRSNVSFTNNRAERDLRMAKVKQKVSGCFRTEKYAKAYCRISSYLQTMANKGYNPLVAIQMALAGEFI